MSQVVISTKECDCRICFQTAGMYYKATIEECKHSFCTDCIVTWWRNSPTCVLCRRKFHNVFVFRNFDGSYRDTATLFSIQILLRTNWVSCFEMNSSVSEENEDTDPPSESEGL